MSSDEQSPFSPAWVCHSWRTCLRGSPTHPRVPIGSRFHCAPPQHQWLRHFV